MGFDRLAVAVLLLTGLGAGAVRAEQPALEVVATTGMIADAARNIGGERVDVTALMGPGVDPHGYRQTRSDIVALTGADLVLWHGLALEAQLEPLLRDLAEERAVVAVADALPADALIEHAAYAGRPDPHVWMDPELWSLAVEAVRDALSAARPEDAARFEANTAAYLDALARLDAYAADVLGSIPEPRRVLVSAHDAFAYLGRAYDVEVVGIQGISTESEAGLARVAEVVDLLVDRGIGAVFVETSVSDRNVRALAEGAGARGHAVVVGGELYSDAMGEAGTYEGTYLGMIDHNVTTIARALGGSAPERGMAGRLQGGS